MPTTTRSPDPTPGRWTSPVGRCAASSTSILWARAPMPPSKHGWIAGSSSPVRFLRSTVGRSRRTIAGVTKTMPAAVYLGDGDMTVKDVPVPTVDAGEALVEVSHCGICGTDLHLVLERYARPDSVLGHEWSGTIAALGDDVDGWELGERVVCDTTPGCGECRACRRGRPAVCLRRATPDFFDFTGAFTRYKKVAAAQLLRIPDTLSIRDAALTEPVAVTLHTVGLSGVTPEDRVLITGA